MQWRASQDFPPENYMMPMGPSAYNPYWNGMQPGMEGFGGPYGGPMPYMGYGLGPMPMDIPFGGVFPQDHFGAQVNMMPFPPQRYASYIVFCKLECSLALSLSLSTPPLFHPPYYPSCERGQQ